MAASPTGPAGDAYATVSVPRAEYAALYGVLVEAEVLSASFVSGKHRFERRQFERLKAAIAAYNKARKSAPGANEIDPPEVR